MLSAAAVALSAFTVVRDDREELAGDLASELMEIDEPYTDEEFYDDGLGMSGVNIGPTWTAGCPEETGGAADLGPRSPDELDPVVDAGETVVIRYDLIDCEQPINFSLTLDNVRRQTTAPEGGYPKRPRNGTYVVVDVTVRAQGYFWPDFLTFSILGPGGVVASSLFSDSMFAVEPGEPGDPTTATLVFDVDDSFDLIRFDDPGPGSASWRI